MIRSNHNEQADDNASVVSNYLSKCYNKLADTHKQLSILNDQLNDDCIRPNVKQNLMDHRNRLKNEYDYWEDEQWLAIEQLNRLDKTEPSNNN